MDPHIWEDGEHIYIVAPVAPFSPGNSEIEEYAFAEELRSMAPNDNLMWLKGHYVEADNANLNGQMWTAGELKLKQLTPRLMPVTVMHDPRTAVGLIADAKLSTPDKDQVPRSRIDTSLAVWQHRFPEIAEEVMANYQAGTLMQSMECVSPHYACEECGKTFPKLPGGAEEELWCEHLSGVGGDGSSRAGRILGNVTFTGTGLIFGTRGSRGAYDEAHLDVFESEVAEFHAEAHDRRNHTTSRPTSRSKSLMDIDQAKYDELMARPTKAELDAAQERASEAEQARDEAVKEKEAAEVAQKTAEDEKAEAIKEKDKLEEKANASALADERLSKIGAGFTKKLPESISTRLKEQAKDMSDEDWTARLEELSELTGVKPDEDAPEGEEPEFAEEEVASAQVGRTPNAGKAPTPEARKSVLGGLASKA